MGEGQGPSCVQMLVMWGEVQGKVKCMHVLSLKNPVALEETFIPCRWGDSEVTQWLAHQQELEDMKNTGISEMLSEREKQDALVR